jgi:hypothetical protein
LNRFIALFASLMVVALIAVGCGSSDDSTTDSTASLTKAEFVKQGNAICKEGNAQFDSEFEQLAEEKDLKEDQPPPQAVLDEAAETILVPGISKQIEELRALGTPEGDEGEVEDLLTNAEEALEEAEEDPSVLTEDEDAGPFVQVNQEVREYGLTVCGEE